MCWTDVHTSYTVIAYIPCVSTGLPTCSHNIHPLCTYQYVENFLYSHNHPSTYPHTRIHGHRYYYKWPGSPPNRWDVRQHVNADWKVKLVARAHSNMRDSHDSRHSYFIYSRISDVSARRWCALCIHPCMCVYVYNICIYIYVCIYVYICVCMCMYVSTHVCMYTFV